MKISNFFPLMIFFVLVSSSRKVRKTINDYLGKHYSHDPNANFDILLSTLELWNLIPVAPFWYPTDTLTKSGKLYSYYSESFVYVTVQQFYLNKPSSFQTIDGRNVESTFTANENTLREVQVEESGRITRIDRTFTDETLTIVIKRGNITAIRLHKFVLPEKGRKYQELNQNIFNNQKLEQEETKSGEPEEK